jgi:hypothetical protein
LHDWVLHPTPMEKPTLLILPGLLEDADAFSPQIEA